MNENINKITQYVFDCDFFSDDFDPEGNEAHLDKANELMESHSWNTIFPVWNNYLHTQCQNPEDVINFVNLYMYYGACEQCIPDPYDFVGYIFYKVDIRKYWDIAGDTIDSVANAVLQNSGKISLMKDPYYRAWEDPKVLEVIDNYRSSEDSPNNK